MINDSFFFIDVGLKTCQLSSLQNEALPLKNASNKIICLGFPTNYGSQYIEKDSSDESINDQIELSCLKTPFTMIPRQIDDGIRRKKPKWSKRDLVKTILFIIFNNYLS